MVYDYHCHVLAHRHVGDHLKVLTLRPVYGPDTPGFDCRPGQFVMIDLPTPVFYFRRPMSVLNVYENGVFEIFYRIHGKGTAMMAELSPGDELNVLGPLGNSLTPPSEPGEHLVIGGGIGIAPLYFLGARSPQTPHCFYGVRSVNDVGLGPELNRTFGDRLHLSTDDGSAGTHGNVCDLLNQHGELIRQAKSAAICGPTIMMRHTAELLRALNPTMRIEASLEEIMPCGTGACSGCVVFRNNGQLPSKTCVEGPVFDADTIIWPGHNPNPQEVAACYP